MSSFTLYVLQIKSQSINQEHWTDLKILEQLDQVFLFYVHESLIKMLDAWQLLTDDWSVALKTDIKAMQKYSKACLRVHGSTYFILCLIAVPQLGGALKFISVVFQFTAHVVNPGLRHSLTFWSLICNCSRLSLSSLQHTILESCQCCMCLWH